MSAPLSSPSRRGDGWLTNDARVFTRRPSCRAFLLWSKRARCVHRRTLRTQRFSLFCLTLDVRKLRAGPRQGAHRRTRRRRNEDRAHRLRCLGHDSNVSRSVQSYKPTVLARPRGLHHSTTARPTFFLQPMPCFTRPARAVPLELSRTRRRRRGLGVTIHTHELPDNSSLIIRMHGSQSRSSFSPRP